MDKLFQSLHLRAKTLPTWALVLAAFALAHAGVAESNPWTSVGPFGVNASVHALAVDPSHPSTLYAGIGTLETDRGGLFKSTDGGLTWSRTGGWPSSTDPLSYPLTIVIDPAHPSTVYAGGLQGLFKSDDGGASWRSIGAGLPGGVFALVLDPKSTSTAYAVGGGVFKTTDGGETWADVSHGLQPVTGDIAIDPTTPSTLYVASDASAVGVYKSTDGGGSWTSVLGVQAQKVFVMNATPQIVFASTSSGVLRSVDRGATWASAATGLTGSFALAFASDAHDVYASNGYGVFRAAGGGVEWTQLGNAGPVWSLALDPSSPSTIFAGADQTGFLRSLDGGTSWTSSNIGLANVFVSALGVSPTEPSTLYAGVRPGGVFKTTDRGATWTAANPIVTQEPASAFAFDPSAPGVVYVALSRDGLFRTADGGATWSPANTGLAVPPFYGSQMVSALAVDPLHPSTLYAGLSTFAFGGIMNGYVFKSTDQGGTWTQLPVTLGGWILGLAVDPRSPSSVYVNGARSTDAGATWQLLDGPCNGRFAGALTVASDSSLYTTCGSAYRSTDHAQSWVALGSDGTSLAVDPTDPLAVYLGGPSGVTRTLDGGATWSTVNDGLTDPAVTALAVDPAHPSSTYAGTNSTGVFSRDFSGRADPLCIPSSTTLCLVGNRFKAEVAWSVPSEGRSGNGMARPLTTDTGSFWFFSPDNIELVLKVLDGRSLNGAFWVFYGALSDVQYTVTVTDTQTGAVQAYVNPAGALSSRADTSAFPELAAVSTGPAAATRSSPVVENRSAAELYGLYAVLKRARDRREPVVAGCVQGGAVLCLDAARFQVTVAWEVPDQGASGDGVAVPLTGNTGYFWFFNDSNVELVVKVLDGDAINGHHWVFYGALSNVKYTITVTDTQTGAIRTYDNASGELASVADTNAF